MRLWNGFLFDLFRCFSFLALLPVAFAVQLSGICAFAITDLRNAYSEI